MSAVKVNMLILAINFKHLTQLTEFCLLPVAADPYVTFGDMSRQTDVAHQL